MWADESYVACYKKKKIIPNRRCFSCLSKKYIVFSKALFLSLALPQGPPRIAVERDRYSAGDELRANCTAGPSRPQPLLAFFINDEPLSSKRLASTFASLRTPSVSSGRLHQKSTAVCVVMKYFGRSTMLICYSFSVFPNTFFTEIFCRIFFLRFVRCFILLCSLYISQRGLNQI